MTNHLAAHARELLDANAFLTLGTADAAGQPWVSPVYMAAEGVQRFYLVSEIWLQLARYGSFARVNPGCHARYTAWPRTIAPGSCDRPRMRQD